MTNEDSGTTLVPNVQNGTYTIAHPTKGHFTIKLYTVQRGNLVGKRVLSLLVGPDNESNYRGVAFWDDQAKRANVWKRFRGLSNVVIDGYHWTHDTKDVVGVGMTATQIKLCIWSDLAIRGDGTGPKETARSGYWAPEGYTLLHAGVCVICNRKLTDPTSIERGIGPTCEGRQ